MIDDTRPHPNAPEAIDRLREEVKDLRLQIEEEIRTRHVVVVDEAGVGRIRLSADGGTCQVALLDVDGFERITLVSDAEHGALRIAGRHRGTDPARIDVFALDPEDDQGTYVGLELVDAGASVAGFTTIESHPPRTWVAPR